MAVRFSTDRASFLLSALARSRVFGALVVTREGAGKGQESLESERDMTAPLLLLLPSFLPSSHLAGAAFAPGSTHVGPHSRMTGTTSHLEPPTHFQAAVFQAPGAPLELAQVEYRKPGHGSESTQGILRAMKPRLTPLRSSSVPELAVKVEAAVLSDLDAVSELGLLRP